MKITTKKAIKSIVTASAVYGGLNYLLFHEVMHRNAVIPQIIFKTADKKIAENQPKEPDERVTWFENQQFEEFTLENERGLKLRGYLLRADEPSDTYVFCSHGYRNCAMGEFNYMTKFHHDAGRNVFLVDHQASGESEGKYISFGYYEYRDCMGWLTFMIDTFGKDIEIILHGVSMGSATVMLMSGDDALPENVKFTIADCGYTSEYNEFKYVLKGAHVPSFPLLNSVDLFNKIINGFSFKDVDALESVSHAKVPMLFIHGKTDTFVPTYMAPELYEACSSEYKDILLVDDAWHGESYRKNAPAYEAKVNEFSEKFIKNNLT